MARHHRLHQERLGQVGPNDALRHTVPKQRRHGLWLRNVAVSGVTRLGLTKWLFGPQLGDRLKLENYRQE